jgi:hypothetical protein
MTRSTDAPLLAGGENVYERGSLAAAKWKPAQVKFKPNMLALNIRPCRRISG